MSPDNLPEPRSPLPEEPAEDFKDLLKDFERTHSRKSEPGSKQVDATVVALSAESAFLDIGYKTEGILPLTAFDHAKKAVEPGDRFLVTVKGRDLDGYYELSLLKLAVPKDFTSLEEAFAEKAVVSGTVTALVKGGFTVDLGVRAFMPASRSGVRDAAEMEKLVGQEIRCRITKLDVDDEDVVVDRRGVLEEEERATKDRRYAEINEGDIVTGTVRSLTDYGAFLDLGGMDGLLHIGDIAWSRIAKPSDVLTVGDTVQAKVLKIDPETRKIGLGLKQLLPHPWDAVAEKYKAGDRVRGTVTRDADFGAFVEIEPGVEGLIHISEMSWGKKVRKPSDIVKTGDIVDAVILRIEIPERRMSLGLKQALGDPWADVPQRFPVGSTVEGPITSFMKFGAFLQVAEGVEGMIHISEIVADKRLNHPSDELRVGQIVKAKVLDLDSEKRQLKLSLKQLIPTGLDEFLAEQKPGDTLTGRVMTVTNGIARIELGEGVLATCQIPETEVAPAQGQADAPVDFSALGALLKSKWKGDTPAAVTKKREELAPGQIRSFRIRTLDPEAKTVELDLI